LKNTCLLIIFLLVSSFSYGQTSTETEAANLFFPRNISNKFINETEANKILNQIATDFSKKAPSNIRIKIIAYAADTPNEFDAWVLSKERAEFIQNELVILGIDKKNIEITGSGPTNKWGNNEYEEERQPNRRATIIFVERTSASTVASTSASTATSTAADNNNTGITNIEKHVFRSIENFTL